MFAFFGFDTRAVIIPTILGAIFVGGIVVILLVIQRSSRSSNLEKENRRLRAELDRDRNDRD